MIDRATVDKILDAAQIVDVVSEFVTLRKSGMNYKGLCPFHDDRNPSFMVSPAKNICHCFVCGKGGTPAGFLMEHEQMTYPEALRWLAKKYNIEIVEKELTDEERAQQNERESLFIVNEWARDWFHDILKNDPDGQAIGKQYFRSRGIRDDIIEKFQLGYAPQKRDALATAAQRAGYKAEYLVKTGLCIENERGMYDRYSGRAIFPWLNVSGKVVAFGGRVLDSRTKGVAQKYVNSPDSEIYHKERELYGIYQAKKAIVKEDRVFMVEGYTDVIAMHQAGIENVVANSGTALTIHQIKLLRRFTQNITFLYDGDDAGIHAAMRGTNMILEEGMNLKVLLLPDGDDPDSFARKHSTEELKRYIETEQQDFISFMTKQTVEGVSDPVKRSEGISAIVQSISVIPNPILRSTYLSDLSMRLGMKEQTLLNTMNQFIRKNIEEKRKEKEREQAAERMENGEVRGENEQVRTLNSTSSPLSSLQDLHERPQVSAPAGMSPEHPQSARKQTSLSAQFSVLETLLIREVIRHGEEIIYNNIETNDGQAISLSVAQYIEFDMGQDNLLFSEPLYNQILAEATAHCGEQGFKAEQYFTNHPDIEVSRLATSLAVDRHQLGGRFMMQPSEGSLRQRVVHLMMDYRMELMSQRLKEIQTAIRQASNDMEHVMQLMKEYKETQELRDALAKRLGRDVVS